MHVSIDEFINYNQNKPVVLVQGLGFVGAVMSLVCSNAISCEYAVIGVDLENPESQSKINSINNGIFPLDADDPKIKEYFEKSLKKRNLYATSSNKAYTYADIIIIDINLDVQKSSYSDLSLNSFEVDLSDFRTAVSVIGQNCKENVLILVETTVPPGTCKNIVLPTLHQELSLRGLSTDHIKVAHSYERVMPGPNYIDSIVNYPRVYSGEDKKSADAAEKFLQTIINTSTCKLTRLESTTASEMAKVLENSYRATNIAFAVEWSRFAEEAGVNLWEIVSAIRERSTHANLMFPNIGVGGYCLTKDPLLASWSRKNFFSGTENLEMSVNSVSINDQMPVYAYKRLRDVFGELKKLRVGFFGVSYRGDVGDTRFSPVKGLFDLISLDSKEIILHDPFVNYWEETELVVTSSIDQILNFGLDLVIISTSHSVYKSTKFFDQILNLKSCFIFDSVGLFNEEQTNRLAKKHKISVIGNGNFS